MKNKHLSDFDRLGKRARVGLEEAILLFLIAIEILDFFRIIPPFLEFIEKTLAFIAFSYLFYKVSLSRIIFGHKWKVVDALLVLAYAFLSAKSIFGFFLSASVEQSILSPFYSLIISNIDFLEKVFFKSGVFILLFLAFILVDRKIGKPSSLHIIHEERPAKSVLQKVFRFFTIYLFFIGFFILVFSFAIEWLATTVDAPVLVLVLIMVLYIIIKHKRRMGAESFLRRVSDSAEEFYEKVILLFQSKDRIAIAIIGVLVLHLLVEIGHFLIPYTTGLAVPWYFAQLGPGHEPLLVPLAKDFLASSSSLQQFFVLLVYVLNVVAALFLFVAPAYLWYFLYKDKPVRPGHLTWMFFGVVSVFFVAPVFTMRRLSSKLLIGTDIITHQVPFLENVFFAVFIGFLVGLIFFLLYRRFPGRTAKAGFILAIVYFAFYLMYFFIDLWHYYVNAIVVLLQNSQFIIGIHLFLFFVLIILFYVGGYVLLVYEVYAKEKI